MFKQLNIYNWLSEFPYAFTGGPDSTDSLDKGTSQGTTQKITLGLFYFVLSQTKRASHSFFGGDRL